jgi:hypothetical protein
MTSSRSLDSMIRFGTRRRAGDEAGRCVMVANTPGITGRAIAVWLQTSHPTVQWRDSRRKCVLRKRAHDPHLPSLEPRRVPELLQARSRPR